MAWHPMKPETIERKARERAEWQSRRRVVLLNNFRDIAAREHALGNHEYAADYDQMADDIEQQINASAS